VELTTARLSLAKAKYELAFLATHLFGSVDLPERYCIIANEKRGCPNLKYLILFIQLPRNIE
jgi:hypothetical protein